MKKEYAKPFLALETFQLDAALAGSCGGANMVQLNHSPGRDCEDEFWQVFGAGWCTFDVVADDGSKSPYEESGAYGCYHGPNGESLDALFIYS